MQTQTHNLGSSEKSGGKQKLWHKYLRKKSNDYVILRYNSDVPRKNWWTLVH